MCWGSSSGNCACWALSRGGGGVLELADGMLE